MKAKTVKEVLTAGRWILENVGWCQGSYYKDKNGSNVGLSARRNPENVACACALGSIYLVETDEPSAMDGAITALADAYKIDSIADFNDDPGRTKQEVLDLFDRAIEGAK